jgi:hypothetical protein
MFPENLGFFFYFLPARGKKETSCFRTLTGTEKHLVYCRRSELIIIIVTVTEKLFIQYIIY